MAEKALIEVLEGSNKGKIEVMFNPAEYSVSNETMVSGEGSSMQFQKMDMKEFSLFLFYDTYERQSDVRGETEKIALLTIPTVELKDTKRPPYCRFIWGGFSYTGIISKVIQKFTMFLETGIPVRADLDVTFKAIVTKEEDAQRKGKEACRKIWMVRSGDRLDSIAHKALKEPAQWRKIAHANKIADPLKFPAADDIGRMLIIPD